MKPPPFEYHAPESLADAYRLLASLEDAKVLAGGQSLIPLLNFRLARPSHLVDINRLQVNSKPRSHFRQDFRDRRLTISMQCTA